MNISKLKSLVCLASMAALCSSAQATLLADPSFEAATDASTTSNSLWTLTANAPDGTNDSAAFSATVWAANDGTTGVWFKPFEGLQDPGDPTANVSLSQTVPSVADSGIYRLTFDSARETNFTAGSMIATLESSGGGSVSVDLLAATYNDGGNMNSNPTSFSLALPGVVAGDNLTVSVVMTDGVDALNNPQSIMFDNFSLVPEPSSSALLGLGLVSMLGLRRRR